MNSQPRNKDHGKSKFILLALVFLCLFNNELTLGFLNGVTDKNTFQLVAVFISILIVAFNIKTIYHDFKIWLIILTLLLISLILESYIKYNSFFIYPHVFSKLTIIFVFFATYLLAISTNWNYIKIFTYIILFFYVFDLMILGWLKYYNPLALYNVDPTIGGAGDSRVFHAEIIYLFIIPFLYFYSRYLQTKRIKYLLFVLFVLSILIFQNHRSIWVATILSFFIYIFIANKIRITGQLEYYKRTYLHSALSLLFFFCVVALIIVITNTNYTLGNRFYDIINWKESGSGYWRYEQIESYLPLIYNNIFWGLRFTGFEIPIMGPGQSFFENYSGQHFHNAYLDILFYHGLIGLVLIYGLIVAIIIRLFKKRNKNSNDIILISFVIGIFPFSLAYGIPFSIWGILGIAAMYAFKPKITFLKVNC